MLKVRRANVVLRINDTEKQHYLDKGYSILDADGKVVEEAVPKGLNELQKAFYDHVEKIKELEAKVKELEKELEEKSAEKPVEEKPKKSSKKKVAEAAE